VDSVWEQKKLEARKRLENAAESPASSAPRNDGVIIFHERNCPAKVYSEPAGQQAVQSSGDAHYVAVPRCTLVAGRIDLTTGGEEAKTPMRKLDSQLTGACSYPERSMR